ncbi:hypothetical protein PQC12_gp057 [Synechococcus phage S-SCSM1]|uniref:Uncharacterized protein n=1 Tax=Synechococcus phage S-SCSM1 TaxID=2588487 RepID=A0A6M2ZHH8_9CAUD|nr:hypothetical protein PQC12_gp057 [Synechococcus phage S-SCSM1]QFG06314.1 hypothetical protein SSCSM1_57 [Synechococcus phage S-SCSM1]
MTERFRTTACPYCGKNNTSCAEIVSLSTAWIRQACMIKHKGVPLRELSSDRADDPSSGL